MNDITKYLLYKFTLAGCKTALLNYVLMKYVNASFNMYIFFYCFIL